MFTRTAPRLRGALALLALTIAGCGGGVGPTVPGRATEFSPNYVPALASAHPWSRTSLTVRLDDGGRAEAGACLDTALARWGAALGGSFTFTRVAGGPADIVVSLLSGAPESGVAGITDLSYSGGGRATRAAIQVDGTLPVEWLTPVIAHELGHAMGIGGHSGDASDLLYPVVPAGGAVTLRDRNTIFTLYAGLVAAADTSRAVDSGETTIRLR